jgi:hypothetical protein
MERWRATAFVIAGLLLFASPATKALALFVDASLPTWLVVILVFPGLLASMVGLLGLYPTLARQVPRLSLAGGVVAAMAASATAVTFGWMLAASVPVSIPGGVVTPPPGLVVLSLMVSIALGFALFGVASLRTTAISRSIGLLLLGFAVPWVVILAVTPVYGSDLPGWLALVLYGVIPPVLLATGHVLRDGSVSPESDELSRRTAAG